MQEVWWLTVMPKWFGAHVVEEQQQLPKQPLPQK
jgi:hypothetical protein